MTSPRWLVVQRGDKAPRSVLGAHRYGGDDEDAALDVYERLRKRMAAHLESGELSLWHDGTRVARTEPSFLRRVPAQG